MSDLQLWSLIVGFIAPIVLPVLQQPTWPRQLRTLVMVGFCVVAGGLTAYFNGDFSGRRLVSAILVVTLSSITFYKGLWKPVGVAPALERATSPHTD